MYAKSVVGTSNPPQLSSFSLILRHCIKAFQKQRNTGGLSVMCENREVEVSFSKCSLDTCYPLRFCSAGLGLDCNPFWSSVDTTSKSIHCMPFVQSCCSQAVAVDITPLASAVHQAVASPTFLSSKHVNEILRDHQDVNNSSKFIAL